MNQNEHLCAPRPTCSAILSKSAKGVCIGGVLGGGAPVRSCTTKPTTIARARYHDSVQLFSNISGKTRDTPGVRADANACEALGHRVFATEVGRGGIRRGLGTARF